MPKPTAENPVRHRDVTVRAGGVFLAGSLWLPQRDPTAVVLMHPGSGPSDRHNDVFFPPIREHLLASGIGVSSFDKRGVGGSTGRWENAAVAEQADDLLACLEVLVAETSFGAPVGVFGHSQGGWVVVEAAGRDAPIAFVVTSSGPGVSPAEQERFALRAYARRGGVEARIPELESHFDRVVSWLREGATFEEARRRIDGTVPPLVRELGLPVLPESEDVWRFMAALIDYDPRPALGQIRVPVLALFGAEDEIVPVERSVAVYRAAVRPDLLTVEVLPRGDHRLQTGEPARLVDGYLDTLSSFIASADTSTRATRGG